MREPKGSVTNKMVLDMRQISKKFVCISVMSRLRLIMDGGGFEPPKQVAADLQSVPFGHSGIHPKAKTLDLHYTIQRSVLQEENLNNEKNYYK